MAKQLLIEKGVLPSDFYNTSLSDFIEAENALSRDERNGDGYEMLRALK